jgi:hypothetical protein
VIFIFYKEHLYLLIKSKGMKTASNNIAIEFARKLEANKQKHKKILLEKMQSDEYLTILERLKSKQSATI